MNFLSTLSNHYHTITEYSINWRVKFMHEKAVEESISLFKQLKLTTVSSLKWLTIYEVYIDVN